MNTAKVQCKQIIIKVFVLDDPFLNGTVGVKANRSFTYTALGKVETVTDSMNYRYEYSYDTSGRNTQVKDANGGYSNAAYDLSGNIVRSIDITAQKEYNYTYENGRIERSAEYDVTFDTNGFVIGKTLTASVRYSYDEKGLLSKKRTKKK